MGNCSAASEAFDVCAWMPWIPTINLPTICRMVYNYKEASVSCVHLLIKKKNTVIFLKIPTQ